MKKERLALLLPALAAFLLFLPMLGGGFLYDDHELLTRNPRIGDPGLLLESFQKPFWEVISPLRTAAGFYRPLGAWLLAGCWHLFGDWAPGYHLVSLLLHAGCAAALAALALALGLSARLAGLAGVFFALHGAHVEAVAWISSAPDLLAALFALLGLTTLARGRLLAAAALLLAGMLAKEAAIGAWLIAMGWIALAPPAGLVRARAFAALGAAAAALWALRALAFDSPLAGFDRQNTWHFLPPLEEWTLSLALLGRYLGWLLWPWPHTIFDPLRLDLTWSSPQRLVPALLGVLAALAALWLWLRRGRRSPALLVGLGLLFACLAPVLNTRALGQYPFEERFTYLPSAGFALVAVLFLAWALARLFPRADAGRAAVLGLGGFALLHAASVQTQLPHWKNEEAFFDWARKASPDAMTPHLGYARLMLEKAQRAPDAWEREKWAERGLEAYERSLEVSADRFFVSAIEREMGNLGLGDSLFIGGDVPGAQKVYQQVVGHWQRSAIGWTGLGNCSGWFALQAADRSDAAEFERLWAEALGHYERALSFDPTLYAAMSGKAQALASLRRLPEALPLAEACFEADPANFDYASSLAAIYFELGRLTFARRTLERFLAAAPAHPQRAAVEQTLAGIEAMRAAEAAGAPR
jgi:tetratricopeptide (TPR) repeat protein